VTIKRVDVALDERAFVHVDGRPVRYLAPGRHRIAAGWFRSVEVVRVPTRQLTASLQEEQLALVPAGDLTVLRLAPTQRAIVRLRGSPVRYLGAGEHQVWTVARTIVRTAAGAALTRPAVEIEVLDVSGVATEPLPRDVRALVPDVDHVEVTVPQGHVGLRFVEGVLDALLAPGRHAAWTVQRRVHLAALDLRERLLHVTGQEVMTADHVSLRLNLSAAFRVADATRVSTVARDPEDVLYLALQIAAREAVATRTLDELLAERDALAGAMGADVARRAEAVGLAVVSFALKDLVLPGEVRALYNRVVAARKEAEANVILRREETAATRSLAQTARVLADNPLLVRLKELEAYAELAGKVGQVSLVLGDGALERLRLDVPK